MKYRELTTKEIVSLADKLRETIETCKNANVETALTGLRNAINLPPGNTPATDKASDMILKNFEEMAYEVGVELENRLKKGRRLVERLERLEREIIFEDDYPEHRYFIALAVDKDKMDVSWNTWEGEVHNSCSYFRDGALEIPDEDFLRDYPVEWLVEHLQDGTYDVDIEECEEDYDEGFGEEEGEEAQNNVEYEEDENYDEGFGDVQ